MKINQANSRFVRQVMTYPESNRLRGVHVHTMYESCGAPNNAKKRQSQVIPAAVGKISQFRDVVHKTKAIFYSTVQYSIVQCSGYTPIRRTDTLSPNRCRVYFFPVVNETPG